MRLRNESSQREIKTRKWLESHQEYKPAFFCYKKLNLLNDELNLVEKQITRYKAEEITGESLSVVTRKLQEINYELNNILSESEFPEKTKKLIESIIKRNDDLGKEISWPWENRPRRAGKVALRAVSEGM